MSPGLFILGFRSSLVVGTRFDGFVRRLSSGMEGSLGLSVIAVRGRCRRADRLLNRKLSAAVRSRSGGRGTMSDARVDLHL